MRGIDLRRQAIDAGAVEVMPQEFEMAASAASCLEQHARRVRPTVTKVVLLSGLEPPTY